MTTGLVIPNAGKIFLNDRDITKYPVYKRAQCGIGYLAQEASVFRKMTVEDNIRSILEMGTLTPDEAKVHPRKNIITRALGVDYELRIDFDIADIGENDVLILCTDGLTNFVEPQEIYELTDDGKFYEYAERLVDRANSNGGGDNITVVTVSY